LGCAMRSILLVGSAALVVGDQRTDALANANPIRKVVTMLQTMQKKVEAEGAKDKELFEKFMCYCKTGVSDLERSVGDAGIKIPSLGSDIEGGEAKVLAMKEELKQAQVDRSDAKAALESATALRNKEAAEFSKKLAELKTNVAAIHKAIAAIDNGMAGALLQTDAAQILRRVAISADMSDVDREDVMAFLSQGASYAPASGSISGILKEIGDEMSGDLKSLTDDEKAAIVSYDQLEAAKRKEVAALNKEIETKLSRVGQLSVEIVQMKNDLTDTQEMLMEDTKFLKDLRMDCSTKAEEFQEIVKTRQQELLALADTVKILNDDDALELFKKTLPGAGSSLLQTTSDMHGTIARALNFVKRASENSLDASPGLDFISMALRGKKIGFDKVIKMIDNLVATLTQEQLDDEHKKEYCAAQLDLSDDKKKGLEKSISDLETSIVDAKDGIITLKEEIDALEDGVKTLDKQVSEQTEQRKEEHDAFTELMASNSAAVELLGFAKNRLNKFYNPKLYKPTSFLQVSNHHGSLHREAPEAPGSYKKKAEESGGVIAMVDALVADLNKEITESETIEKDSQTDYEQAMSDSKEKRATDSKALTEKQQTKADLEGDLQQSKEDETSATKQLMATESYISSLHAECDWLLKYFDMRKEARVGEIDSLNKAKAVLSGADFSLIQTKTTRFLHK